MLESLTRKTNHRYGVPNSTLDPSFQKCPNHNLVSLKETTTTDVYTLFENPYPLPPWLRFETRLGALSPPVPAPDPVLAPKFVLAPRFPVA